MLTDSQLEQENTYGSLSLVILFTSWRDGLDPDRVAEVKLDLARGGVDCLAGYRLEQILIEAFDCSDVEYIDSTKVYQKIGDFSERGPRGETGCSRGLFAMTKASVESVMGSVANFVFQYSPPIFRFKRGDRQLLDAALEGLTDRELSSCLGVSLETVKKRWASVFEQVEEIMPNLLPVAGGRHPVTQARGLQKRHRVLAYIRNHPEELRPHLC